MASISPRQCSEMDFMQDLGALYGTNFMTMLQSAMEVSGLSLTPKLEQIEALFNVLKGKDVLVNLPTGFGKSWIYSILPFINDFISSPTRQSRGRVGQERPGLD